MLPNSPPLGLKGWSLHEAIDAVMAHDRGEWGPVGPIEAEALRAGLVDFLGSLDDDAFRGACASYARRFLTDDAIARGHGLGDVQDFLEWLAGLGLGACW